MLKKIPLPITGVALGLAALGNLLESYSKGMRLACGCVAAALLLLFLFKMIRYPSLWREDMKSPILASVFATFPMAWMLLAAYLKPYAPQPALFLWYLAILCHILLIVYFTWAFLRKIQWTQIFSSYFIVYVGIVAASVSSPAFGMQSLGLGLFWFGFVMLLLLLILVTYRYGKYRKIPEPAQPLLCIYAAPASLCLAGYLQVSAVKSSGIVIFLMALSGLLYLMVLANLPRLLRLKFYPSYAAFTFPFVISAIAMKQSAAYWAQSGTAVPWLQWVVLFQTAIATALVFYALVRFLLFFLSIPKANRSPGA